MREVTFDTETTGFDPFKGHRIIEMGCVELINRLPRARFRCYINPCGFPVDEGAFKVHGISEEFLAHQPTFPEIVQDFLDFVGDAPLVIHNAAFDMKFLNHHLEEIGLPAFSEDRVIDTLRIARQKFPGAQASMDALCRKFNVDNSKRTAHGALLDSELLAEVYLGLMGGRQTALDLSAAVRRGANLELVGGTGPLAVIEPDADELAAHQAFVGRLKRNPWADHQPAPAP